MRKVIKQKGVVKTKFSIIINCRRQCYIKNINTYYGVFSIFYRAISFNYCPYDIENNKIVIEEEFSVELWKHNSNYTKYVLENGKIVFLSDSQLITKITNKEIENLN